MSSQSAHLGPEDLYDHVESRLSGRRLRDAEAHLASCPECAETLAMVLRAERPASREEEALLARAAPRSPEARVEEMRAAIAESMPGRGGGGKIDWAPLLVALAVVLVVATSGVLFYAHVWLPAQSRRVASETLAAMVELRQATGRLPLRYVTEFERASVTRSAFDDVDANEESLLGNLRAAVERSGEPEAELTLGLLLLDDGRLEEAEMFLRSVLETEPRSAGALNALAVIHYERAERQPRDAYAQLQRGLALLREAQAADPGDLRVLYNFGAFYEALGMPGAARQAWMRYLERDRSSHWAEEAAYQLSQLQGR